MRKVNYRVVLDILVTEEDDADCIEAMESADFWPTFEEDDVDVICVDIDSVGITDSR